MSAPTTTNPVSSSPKRSWRRFTLRALFLLVLAAAIFFGWVAHRVRELKEQARLIDSLRAQGYLVETKEVPGSVFWRLLAGDSADTDAVRLKFRGYDQSEHAYFGPSISELLSLSAFKSLKELTLFGPSVTDDVMASIATLPHLQILYLEDSAITDNGLKYLQRLPGLRWIYINSFNPRRSTIRSKHNNNYPLALTEDGVAALAQIKSLTSVALADVPVGNEGVEALCKNLPNLETLILVGARITDDALAHIANASAIRTLSVVDCKDVTASGLIKLCAMPRLAHLYLSELNVTADDARRIRARLSRLDSTSSVLDDVVRADDHRRARELTESILSSSSGNRVKKAGYSQ